jgi:hypothetical protein
MRGNLTKAAIVLLSLEACLCGPATAQRGFQWRGGGGWGPDGAYARLYDPSTIQTVSGEIVGIEHMTPQKGMGAGVHLLLKTAGETIPIHLGPAWYVEHQDVTVASGDRVEVQGSRISFDGKPAIIAAEVRKGDAALVLRDAAGIPVWAGWRRRGAPR